MRLIDADAFECSLQKEWELNNISNGEWMDIREWLRDAPTVDAVEVVRCKDCKKYIPCQKLPIGTSKWCDLFDRATCEMNYCGWGERREDGKIN